MIRAVPLVFLLGCTVSEASFPRTYARAVCDRMSECQRATYEQQYDNRRECVDAWSDLADSFLDAADVLGATYAPNRGYQCVSGIRSASCGDFSSAAADCDLFE